MAQILIFQMGACRHIAPQLMAHQYMKFRQVAGRRKQFCRFLYIALPALEPGLQHISAAVFQRRKAFSFLVNMICLFFHIPGYKDIHTIRTAQGYVSDTLTSFSKSSP